MPAASHAKSPTAHVHDATSEVVRLLDWHRSRHQLWFSFALDELRFTTSYWYGDVDLPGLEARFGQRALEQIYFHIAAFEINKLVSFRPARIDLGPLAHWHTDAFEALWRQVLLKVWAQWRYEHDLPHFEGPRFASNARPATPAPLDGRSAGEADVLSFCGGGKDSLVAMQLLARSGIAHGSLVYAHSVYGRTTPQHALVDRLLRHGSAVRTHRQWIHDDALDAPVVTLHPELEVQTMTAAETPASLFAALPIALAHGYRHLVLAHEASANVGNLVWDETGEDVNHQWGKSREAEALLDDYLRTHLIGDLRYWSLLQPIHDPLVFFLLRDDLDAVQDTHSCNVAKPWCLRCPKCAYVWLGYQAYLPRERVDPIFGHRNLLDDPACLAHFTDMLGLGEHTPFECIGQVEETQLAFALCHAKGLRGQAMDRFCDAFPKLDARPLAERFLQVDMARGRLPTELRDAIGERLDHAVRAARAYALDRLGDPLQESPS